MRTDFSQGILTYPISGNQQQFLFKSGNYVNLQVNNNVVDIIFAHGLTNYLFTETLDTTAAWGPFQSNVDYWLYWDINTRTAIRTFGSTMLQPIYSAVSPSNPQTDQHWFNVSSHKMYVYQMGNWREVIRVFAAKVNNATFTPLGSNSLRPFAGTQAGLVSSNTVAGRILADSVGTPIRKSSGQFFTTEDDFFMNGSPITTIKLEANVLTATSIESIAKYQIVTFSEFGKVRLATYNDISNNSIAVAMENILINHTGTVCVQGHITNPDWNFSNVGDKLWVNSTGTLTNIDPHLADPITYPNTKPPIGRVITPTSIIFDQGLGGIGERGPTGPAGGEKGDKGDPGEQGPPGQDASVDIMTVTDAGIAKLSVDAVNPLDPIVVGDNDPRLTNIAYTTGSTFTGDVILNSDPTQDLQAATKQYVDNHTVTLNDTIDVNVTSPAYGDFLTYDGVNWVNVQGSTLLARPTIVGPNELVIHQTQDYTITNYDDFTTYDLVPISGSVSRVGDTITYIAPDSAQTGGFTINGAIVLVDIINVVPDTPSIDSPVTGSIDLGPSVDFIGSTFAVTGFTDTHEGSDWQLATDGGFNDIVDEVVDSATDKETWTVDNLDPNTEFFVRVRYKGTTYNYSEWSNSISFTTKTSYIPTTEEAKLTASDKESGDNFGYSVAIDSTGTIVVVGAYQEDPDGLNGAGSAYIFTRSGTIWTEEAKLTASDKQASDNFGYSVAIDGTGTRVVIGAYHNDPDGVSDAGSAYIFTRSGTVWTEEAKLMASDKQSSDYFGSSVSIDDTGTRVVIGAYGEDPNSVSAAGSAYIFTRSGTIWTEDAKLTASDKQASDYFGSAVAIDGTGTTVVIGAYQEDPDGLTGAGSAYIYAKSGAIWTEEAKLTTSDKQTGDNFGHSVAINDAGTVVVIGADLEAPDGVGSAGSAYTFVRSGSIWTEDAKLTASDKQASDTFGRSVDIDGVGTRVVIGAYQEDPSGVSNAGSAYVFS